MNGHLIARCLRPLRGSRKNAPPPGPGCAGARLQSPMMARALRSNPKSERRCAPKSEARRPKSEEGAVWVRISDFGFPSDFGFRVSGFRNAAGRRNTPPHLQQGRSARRTKRQRRKHQVTQTATETGLRGSARIDNVPAGSRPISGWAGGRRDNSARVWQSGPRRRQPGCSKQRW